MKTKRTLAMLLSAVLAATLMSPAIASAADAMRPWIGFYVTGNYSSMDALYALESKVGTKAAVTNFFVADSESFPTNRARAMADHGSIPMITLEFHSLSSGGVAAINNGSKDAYIARFADGAKAHGSEIWLRPFHEMNSNWYPWAGATNGNSAPAVVAAWQRVRNIFASRGATNVKFVWAPNNESVPNVASNSIESYWPGDAYVDILAIDGYNFGTAQSWSTWRSWDSVMANAYARVTALSAKPLIIAETASVEQGGNKAAWITDMFAKVKTNYPRIVGIVWFSTNNSPTDWRVDSSAGSLEAFRLGVASLATVPSDPTTPPPTNNGKKKIRRFYNKALNTHFYTASDQETTQVLSTLGSMYTLEGIAYEVDTTDPFNSQDLYRFYNRRSGTHLYTASAAERDSVIRRLGATYSYEGVAYPVSLNPAAGSLTVYRFYNVRTGSHFYTSSTAERDAVVATLGSVMRYEGIAFFVGQ